MTRTQEKRSPAFKTWENRIQSSTFSKGQCQQFAAAVVPLSQGAHPGGKRTNLSQEEASDLLALVRKAGGVRLEERHELEGRRWLTLYAAKRLALPESVLENFSHFSYQGGAVRHLPVWRIHLSDGRSVDYYASAWQSGDSEAAWWWSHTLYKSTAE